ncbi:protein phosphatase 1 regulatory subunit 1C-like isoform X2 [Conger conger]|uniref:protein phosphatase 1 regulatory subunit 1C-like isoform X2 n=1 Tax=Conger conger TaxID=82655 RepID=UPI002A5AF968|nr:protein phosphatase 1 regulatory subunit 1C-like isoform X2 [Conger conger]
MEPNSPKKIQFSVPLFQSQLDPQAAEHIRRRRPTPATLVFYTDPAASGAEDRKRISSQAENAELSPAQRKQGVFTPPTMKEGKLLKMPTDSSFPEEEEGLPELETLLQQLEPLPKQPKEAELLSKQLEPRPKELESLPKELESLPKVLESRPKELEPLPKELESLPKELEPVPKQPEGMIQQGDDGDP